MLLLGRDSGIDLHQVCPLLDANGMTLCRVTSSRVGRMLYVALEAGFVSKGIGDGGVRCT